MELFLLNNNTAVLMVTNAQTREKECVTQRRGHHNCAISVPSTCYKQYSLYCKFPSSVDSLEVNTMERASKTTDRHMRMDHVEKSSIDVYNCKEYMEKNQTWNLLYFESHGISELDNDIASIVVQSLVPVRSNVSTPVGIYDGIRVVVQQGGDNCQRFLWVSIPLWVSIKLS